jgi:hypothetical protein
MPILPDPNREITYWRELLTRVAQDLETTAGTEPDPKRQRWLAARAMRIRQRLHEGVPEGFEISQPNRPASTFGA